MISCRHNSLNLIVSHSPVEWWQIAFKSCLPLFCQNYMFSNSLGVYKQSHMTQHMPRALCHLSKPAVIASWHYSVVGCLLVLVIITLFYRKFENNYSLCYKIESGLCLVCFERGHYWLDIIDELIVDIWASCVRYFTSANV